MFRIIHILFCGALASHSLLNAQEICPQIMHEGLNKGGYHFTYKSSSWRKAEDADSPQWYYHCVRNLNSKPLWVDWKETGLTGFIISKTSAHIQFSSSEKAYEEKNVELWFGAGPHKILARTVISRRNVPESVTVEAKQPPNRENSKPKKPYALISRSEIAVPHVERIAQRLGRPASSVKFNDILQAVDQNPGTLMPFSMKFTSTPIVDANGIWQSLEHTCEYRLGERLKFSVLRMKIADVGLHLSVFDSNLPVQFGGEWRDEVSKFKGNTRLEGSPAEIVQEYFSELQILPIDSDIVLASIPISFFGPKQRLSTITPR